MVRLLAKSDIKVDYKQLRKATKAATEATCEKAGYKLASKLVKLIFTTQELSMSCGQGMRVKKGDLRPALDAQRIEVLKGMITLKKDSFFQKLMIINCACGVNFAY